MKIINTALVMALVTGSLFGTTGPSFAERECFRVLQIWRAGRMSILQPSHTRWITRCVGEDVPSPSDRNCSDFGSWREAQTFFEAAGPGDPHRLDADGDGIACEELRGQDGELHVNNVRSGPSVSGSETSRGRFRAELERIRSESAQ